MGGGGGGGGGPVSTCAWRMGAIGLGMAGGAENWEKMLRPVPVYSSDSAWRMISGCSVGASDAKPPIFAAGWAYAPAVVFPCAVSPPEGVVAGRAVTTGGGAGDGAGDGELPKFC